MKWLSSKMAEYLHLCLGCARGHQTVSEPINVSTFLVNGRRRYRLCFSCALGHQAVSGPIDLSTLHKWAKKVVPALVSNVLKSRFWHQPGPGNIGRQHVIHPKPHGSFQQALSHGMIDQRLNLMSGGFLTIPSSVTRAASLAEG
jgi:hypothetical protein